jgi:adenosine 3'-phospho 5'-phosphosulfate transporter B3
MASTEKNYGQLDPLPPVKLLTFDISSWPKPLQFISLCVGVFVLYLIYGYFQVSLSLSNPLKTKIYTFFLLKELIFRVPGMKPHGWYFTLIQFLWYSIFSYSEMHFTTGIVRRFFFTIHSIYKTK